MKIGTFVGKQGIVMTDGEKKYIEESIDRVFKAHGLEYTIEWDSVSDVLAQAVVSVPSLMGGGKCYRDGNGGLVQPEYIRLQFGHEAGYDQEEWGPTYARKKEGEPTLDLDSYHFKSEVIGHERGYRRKHVWHTAVAQTSYTYGTELIDLMIETGTYKLLSLVKKWRREKKDWQLTEIG